MARSGPHPRLTTVHANMSQNGHKAALVAYHRLPNNFHRSLFRYMSQTHLPLEPLTAEILISLRFYTLILPTLVRGLYALIWASALFKFLLLASFLDHIGISIFVNLRPLSCLPTMTFLLFRHRSLHSIFVITWWRSHQLNKSFSTFLLIFLAFHLFRFFAASS